MSSRNLTIKEQVDMIMSQLHSKQQKRVENVKAEMVSGSSTSVVINNSTPNSTVSSQIFEKKSREITQQARKFWKIHAKKTREMNLSRNISLDIFHKNNNFSLRKWKISKKKFHEIDSFHEFFGLDFFIFSAPLWVEIFKKIVNP